MCRSTCILQSLWNWYPGVGYYIAVLGCLAVVVTITRDTNKMSKREKVAWLMLSFLLLFLELHSISLDKRAHDREQNAARDRQIQQFDAITEQAQQHFDATMKGVGDVLATAKAVKAGTESHAQMQISDFQVLRSSFPLVIGSTLKVNSYLVNVGTEDAKDLIADTKIYVGKFPSLDPTEEPKLKRQFDDWWKHPAPHPHWRSSLYEKGRFTGFFSSEGLPLTREELEQIQTKIATFYLFARVAYRDHAGKWQYDTCEWIQDATVNFNTMRTCSVNRSIRRAAH